MTTDPRQKQLTFDYPTAKEAARRERCLRLLERLGQPPEKLTTAGRMFDYQQASQVAQESNQRTNATQTPPTPGGGSVFQGVKPSGPVR